MADRIDSKAFQSMITSADADASMATLFQEDTSGNWSKDVHNALMAAGFTPGLGNIADAADALLYLMEGELGQAGISAAAMIPFAGQMVSAKKALKAARESGETVKLYRGTTDWHKGKMVKDGMHVSPKKVFAGEYTDDLNPSKKGVWAIDDIEEASEFRQRGGGMGEGPLIEYEVPKEWYDSHMSSWSDPNSPAFGNVGWIEGGIPKEFLTKVHKGDKAF